MKFVVVLLALLLVGCSASPPPTAKPEPFPDPTWLVMVPGDARTFDGPSGELLLVYVDETYFMDGVNASALAWKLGEKYTTDYFVEDDDGTLWWYGRKGSWRVGRKGEERREVKIVDHLARFGDRVITLSEQDGPVQVRLRDGLYT